MVSLDSTLSLKFVTNPSQVPTPAAVIPELTALFLRIKITSPGPAPSLSLTGKIIHPPKAKDASPTLWTPNIFSAKKPSSIHPEQAKYDARYIEAIKKAKAGNIDEAFATFKELQNLRYLPAVKKRIGHLHRTDWKNYFKNLAQVFDEADSSKPGSGLAIWMNYYKDVNVFYLKVLQQQYGTASIRYNQQLMMVNGIHAYENGLRLEKMGNHAQALSAYQEAFLTAGKGGYLDPIAKCMNIFAQPNCSSKYRSSPEVSNKTPAQLLTRALNLAKIGLKISKEFSDSGYYDYFEKSIEAITAQCDKIKDSEDEKDSSIPKLSLSINPDLESNPPFIPPSIKRLAKLLD